MDLILLLIFVFTVKGDSDEFKNADFLADDEKEEFIEQVARRIIENVETKQVANQSSVELSEEELVKHESYVKKILKEESNNIRRHRAEKEKEKEAEKDLTVKSIENLKEIQRTAHIDFTRGEREKRRDNKGNEGKSSDIPVEVITENVIIKTKNFSSESKIKKTNETTHMNDYAQSSKEDIEVRHIENPITEYFGIKTNNFEANHSVTTVKINETFQNNETRYADPFKEETNVKHVKRRAIENNSSTETVGSNEIEANNSDINKTEYISASIKHQPTIIDNFDTEKAESEETTDSLSIDDSTSESTITEVTTVNETTVNETTVNETTVNETTVNVTTANGTIVNATTESQGIASIENNSFTQAIYESEQSDQDSYSDCENESNETVKNKDIDLSTASNVNATVVEETTLVKIYIRSNDYNTVTDAAEADASEISMETDELSTKTVTDKIVHDKVQSSTMNEGSSDKILDTTTIFGTSDENNNKTIEMTETFFIMGNNDAADNVTHSGDTKSETIPSNTDKTVESSDVTSIIVPTKNIKNISDALTEMTVPTKTVLTPAPYKNDLSNDPASKGFQAGPIYGTKFNVTYNQQTDQAKEIKNNKDVVEATNKNELNNDKIALDKPILTTIKDESLLTVTESIMTTMYTQIPTLTTTNTVESTTNRVKIYSAAYKNKTAKKKKLTAIKPVKKTHYDKPSLVADKTVYMLKNSAVLVNDDKEKEKDLFAGLQKVYYKQNKNIKETYQVYEVPADKPPFIKDSKAMSEQPYYVPVYNYSPNRAYYNPINRRGPNENDANKIKLVDNDFIDTVETEEKTSDKNAHNSYEDEFRAFKERNFENDDYSDENEIQRKKFGNLGMSSKFGDKEMARPNQLFVRQPAFKGRNYNPNDYEDIDYPSTIDVSGSTRSVDMTFPHMHDEWHPYNSIREKNLKNHVRAVRNVLYSQKLFSNPYKPTEKHFMIETTTEEEARAKQSYRYGEKSSAISLDYYFGRMNPENTEQNDYKKVGYLQNNDETKNVYIDNELFNNNLIKFINSFKYKDDTYVNNKYKAAPHTDLIEEIPMITQESNSQESDKIEIINVRDEKNVYNTLETLEEFNLTLKKQDDSLNIYTRVLKDMVHLESNALKQYDWLGTTIDLQSALDKLLRLIEGVQSIEEIHPSDLELLKYVVFLHKFSYKLNESKIFADKLRKQLLPRNKRKEKHILNEKGLLNRVWLYLRQKRTSNQDGNLELFNNFLLNLQDALYDLHEAIKNIAKVSTFKKQNWFKNIKDLYLIEDKNYLTLLLHMTATRLFGLIEESTRSNLEDDFKSYVRNNRKDTMKTVDEMLMVIRILNYINMLQ